MSGTRGGGLFNAVERSRFSPKAQAMEGARFRQRRRSAPGMPLRVKEGKRDSLNVVIAAVAPRVKLTLYFLVAGLIGWAFWGTVLPQHLLHSSCSGLFWSGGYNSQLVHMLGDPAASLAPSDACCARAAEPTRCVYLRRPRACEDW